MAQTWGNDACAGERSEDRVSRRRSPSDRSDSRLRTGACGDGSHRAGHEGAFGRPCAPTLTWHRRRACPPSPPSIGTGNSHPPDSDLALTAPYRFDAEGFVGRWNAQNEFVRHTDQACQLQQGAIFRSISQLAIYNSAIREQDLTREQNLPVSDLRAPIVCRLLRWRFVRVGRRGIEPITIQVATFSPAGLGSEYLVHGPISESPSEISQARYSNGEAGD